MSKSLGNSPDPLDLIKTFGADGVRVGLLSIAPQGQDIRFDERFLTQGRNFCTKLWNACRFRCMQANCGNYKTFADYLTALEAQPLSVYDEHLLKTLVSTMENYEHLLGKYEFSTAIKSLQQYFRDIFCDWYLEVQKHQSTHNFAVQDIFLRQILLMLNPYVPYITEELWQQLHLGEGFLHQGGWELATLESWMESHLKVPAADIESIEELRTLVSQLRALKAENGQGSNKNVILAVHLESKHAPSLQKHTDLLKQLVGFKELRIVDQTLTAMPQIVTLWGTFFLLLETKNNANDATAIAKEIEQLTQHIQAAEAKLANERFTANAPASVIAGVRKLLEENLQKREALRNLK